MSINLGTTEVELSLYSKALQPVSGRGCPVFQCREEPPSPFLLSLFHYTRVVI